MRHLRVLSRLAWRQGFQSNRPGLRWPVKLLFWCDPLCTSIGKAESVAMAAMPGSHNSKERGAMQRFAPQGCNMMQLLRSSIPLSGKGAGNADFGHLTEALEHSKPHI